VKLYMFEHCSLCFRVRMIAALKRRHLQETVVLDDDTETMVSLVGKLRTDTRRYVAELLPDLEAIDRLIERPLAINGTLSLDDVRVLPLLRSLTVVKGLRLPQKVRNYFESMMSRIGYQPLPAV